MMMLFKQVKEYFSERGIRQILPPVVTLSFITEDVLKTAADAAIQVYLPESSSLGFQS